MQYFAPGLRQILRWMRRGALRLRIASTRRARARAETVLGRLGWLQADFSGRAAEEVERVKDCEREQGELNNHSAQLAADLAGLENVRSERRERFSADRKRIEARCKQIEEELAGPEKELAALRDKLPAIERRLAQLERDLSESNRLYHESLSADEQTPATRAEQTRLRERVGTLPGEIADLHAGQTHARIASEELRKTIERLRSEQGTLAADLRTLEADFAKEDGASAAALKEKEREKARIEKEAAALERGKARPYEQIGRELADHHIAPANQPGTLATVLTLRSRIAALEARLEAVRGETAGEDPVQLRHSLLIWAAIGLAVMLTGLALLPR